MKNFKLTSSTDRCILLGLSMMLAGTAIPAAIAKPPKPAAPTTSPAAASDVAEEFDRSGPVPVPLEPTTNPADVINPYATPGDDARIDAQDNVMFSAALDTFGRNPPAVKVSPERRNAIMLLDAVLHDPYARERKAVQDYHLQRAQLVVDELEKTRITDDSARIWSFYNMGYVVRTKTVTIGFDLISAKHLPGFTLPDALMQRLVEQCDVLFISHTHWDHADPMLAQAFLDHGKPVVAPPDMWAEFPINTKLVKLNRQAGIEQKLAVQNGQQQLFVTTNPGYQHIKNGADVTNNVYLVRTPEGMTFGHTGDNNGYMPSGFEWIDEVHNHSKLDVLFLNDWSMLVPRTLRGFDPRLVISGHFEELGHQNIWARAPFWRGLRHAEASSWPWMVMTWGESITYRAADFPKTSTTKPAAERDAQPNDN